MQFLRLAVLLGLLLPLPTFASMLGMPVNATLNLAILPGNYFDPSLGMVPASYLNFSEGTTVTVQPAAIEFGYQDAMNQIQLDLGDSWLQLRNISSSGIGPFTITLAAVTPGSFQGIFRFNDSFPGNGLSYAMTNGVITLHYDGTSRSGTSVANFGITSVTAAPSVLQAVPEPASMALSGSAILALVLMLHQQRKK